MIPACLWRTETGYQLNGMVCGIVNGFTRLFLSGMRSIADRRESALFCLSGEGELVWESRISSPAEDRLISVFPNLFETPEVGLCLFYSFGSSDNARPQPGCARLVRAETGAMVWETHTRSHHAGNGSCIAGDLNGDGKTELVWWDSANVFCSDVLTGALLWEYSDHIQICHGRPALAQLGGGPAVIVGTEYGNPDGTSSVLALDGRGNLLWQRDGFPEDLGSTPVIAADVDNDREEEFLIVGLDLVHRDRMDTSSLWCFRKNGELVYRAPCACGGLAIARVGGALRGVGVTNTRDGGSHGLHEIRMFSLQTGQTNWSRTISRSYLDAQNPVAADLDGDEIHEFLVATGNPSGYGHDPAESPYADLYAVRGDGELLWTLTCPDQVHQPFVGDVNNDGRNEVLLPCGDGSLSCFSTPGISERAVWQSTGGSYSRWYSLPAPTLL